MLAGLLLLAIPITKRRPKIACVLLFVALVVAALDGCGGGGSSGGGGGGSTTDPGTPAGTYSIQVTAVGGSVSHTVSISVTVQ
jgi:hypothetical protein